MDDTQENIQVRKTRLLLYYDGIQLFAGTDRGGKRFIGCLSGFTPESGLTYLWAGISEEQYRRFAGGKIDLLTLLKNPGRHIFGVLTLQDERHLDEFHPLTPASIDSLPEAGLPGTGLYMKFSPEDDYPERWK